MQINLWAYLSNKHFLSLTGNVVISFVSIVSASLIFRSLNVADMGRWIFFVSLLGLIDSFRAGFVTTAFIRAYSGAGAGRACEVAGSAWLIAGLITAGFLLLDGAAAAALVPTGYTTGEFALFLKWFGITLVATLPGFMAGCVQQAEMRFDKLLYLRLISMTLFLGGVVALMVTKTASLERLIYLNLFRESVCSLSALFLGWTRIGAFGHKSRACVAELFHFGKFSIGSYIGTMLSLNTDTFVIKFALGPAALAIYSLAGRFMEIIDLPLRSAIATAVPSLSAAYNQDDGARLSATLKKNAGALTIALVPLIVLLFIFADVLVYLVGGSKYVDTQAATILRIFVIMAVLFPIDRFFGLTLDVINQPKANFIKVLLTFSVNFVGDFVGIWLLGNVYGIALSSVVTIVVGFVYGYSILQKTIPVTLRDILTAGFEAVKDAFEELKTRLRTAGFS